jgi:hypothetical protein
MSTPALLNNVDHQDLRVLTQRGAAYGDNVMQVQTFAAEFRDLQAHYPIVFQKSAHGSFHPVALLGFQPGQNLFLTETGWDASYLPLAIEREPFLIGRQGEELLVHVDLDSPRIGHGTEGQALFLPHGGSSEYLERVTSVLLAIHQGLQSTPAFVAALLAHELLESFVLDVEGPDGSQNRLAGFYTVNEDRLAQLQGDALHSLHQAGHLQAVYMVVASLSNLRGLIERQHRRLAAAA